jgi:hypothetical protein
VYSQIVVEERKEAGSVIQRHGLEAMKGGGRIPLREAERSSASPGRRRRGTARCTPAGCENDEDDDGETNEEEVLSLEEEDEEDDDDEAVTAGRVDVRRAERASG